MGMNMPEPLQQPLPQGQALPLTNSEQPQQTSPTNPSDIPHILQMNLQFTMVGLLKQMQTVMTSQANMYEKMKSIPLLAQAVTGLHNAFHSTEQLEFDKSKPDNGEMEAQIAKQDADHKYALDLMAQNHEEQIKERKLEMEKQKMEHDMQLKEMQAQIQQQQAEQDASHKEDLHQSQLEQQEIQKAQTIQAAQQQEENHTLTMSNQQESHEADVKAKKDAGSKPEA